LLTARWASSSHRIPSSHRVPTARTVATLPYPTSSIFALHLVPCLPCLDLQLRRRTPQTPSFDNRPDRPARPCNSQSHRTVALRALDKRDAFCLRSPELCCARHPRSLDQTSRRPLAPTPGTRFVPLDPSPECSEHAPGALRPVRFPSSSRRIRLAGTRHPKPC
jgi:hypothetical protein